MRPVQITAHLASPIQVFEDWTPSLDALLEWLILDEIGQSAANPTPEQVAATRPIVEAQMPIHKASLQGEWYWAVSGPQYLLLGEQQDRLRKRWDCQEYYLDWRGKRQKWSTSEGHTKSFDVPQFLRVTDRIDWFAVADLSGLGKWLTTWRCGRIGKKRRAIVWDWQFQEIATDRHLLWDGVLMRPIPISLMPPGEYSFSVMDWGWRPPYWLPTNQAKCAMPTQSVRRIEYG